MILRRYLPAPILIVICAIAVWAQQATIHDPDQSTETQTPTRVDGVPVCESKPPPGKVYRAGVYGVGGGVNQPKPINMPEPKFSNEARAALKKQHIKQFEGVSIVEMTVDEAGVPQDICIKKQAGYGLDKQAFLAVERYRFHPGTLNGKPVSVRLAVEVKFRRF
jgi:hypothetical protein